jgi:hypothetical protein
VSKQLAVAVLVGVIEGKVARERADALADYEDWTAYMLQAGRARLQADTAAMLATRETREALAEALAEAIRHETACTENVQAARDRAVALGASSQELLLAIRAGVARGRLRPAPAQA